MINTAWIAWNLNKKRNYNAIIFSGGIAAYLFTSPIENTFYSRQDLQSCLSLPEVKAHVSAKWSPPKNEKALKALWIMQGVQAIALFHFRKNHLPSLIPLVGVIVALYESSKKPWLQLEYQSDREFSYTNRRLPTTKLTYHTLIFQAPLQASDDTCYCMDHEEIPRDTFYCSKKHFYHLGCLVDSLATNLFNVGKELNPINLRYNWRTKKLIFQIKQDILPHCPVCREQTPVSRVSFNLGKITHIQQRGPN